ncbi:MAG: NHLP family bacteriocin export ABC transporter peptidase/permease/ATPase subunit [Acidobacteriota bacterium]
MRLATSIKESVARLRRRVAGVLTGALDRVAGDGATHERWPLSVLRRRLERWRFELPRPVKSPTVLQMEALECGAASLAIILAHHGRWVPLEKLRIDCGVSRDGSKAANVLKAARRYGMVAAGLKAKPATLRQIDPPMIIHWNFNHFVVFDGFVGKYARINDPAAGPRLISPEELDQSFTGVVLRFAKGPEFSAGGEPPRLLPALGKRMIGVKAGVAFVLLAGLALVLPGLVTPVFSKIFVDQILLRDFVSWVRPLLLAMGITAVVAGALTWLQQHYLLRLETKIAITSSGKFFWHVLRMPIDFFAQRMTGDISSRVAANDRVAQLLSRDLATNVLGTLLIVFYAALMFQYDVALTLVGIGVVSLSLGALHIVSRLRVDANRTLQQEQGKLNGIALSGLKVIETLKAQGGESDLYQQWAGYQTKVINNRQRLELYTQVLQAVPPLLIGLTTTVVLGLGSSRVIEGALTLGGLVAFQALMAGFTQPVQNLVNLGSKLQDAEGDMSRLDDVLRYPLDRSFAQQADALPELEVGDEAESKLMGRLELRDVAFGYNRLAAPLIENFSLTLEPGKRAALVGGSGSGKSTIANLIVGLNEPWDGEILFDGRHRLEIPRSVLNASLASVDQSISLFEGTVRENLTMWDPTIPTTEVITAARDAMIHPDIAARRGGYESEMTEGGANWSGGQRQRLEIARALVGRPSLLVLDEATSALDPTTEKRIDEALRRRGCTCLIVAHRLSTIRDADEIIVMDKGKIVQRGRHEELIEQDGPYSQLIASQ